MQGTDFKRMAEELSMDVKQVKSAYSRVKFKIKQHLKNYHEE